MASSSGDYFYTVLVSPWAVHESICEYRCKGFRFRGRCRHQDEAARQVCGWSELSSLKPQTDEEREYKVCPKCGGPTRWEVDVVED